MAFKDKKAGQEYINAYKREKRRERGLKKSGRKPLTSAEKEVSIENRKVWERAWRKEYSAYNTEKKLLWAAKKRAKAKGLEFDICEKDIIVPTHCPYLGIELASTRPRGDPRRDIATLDRIDPTKGYTKDNIEVMSWLANTMKNNATPELLVKFAKEVLKRYEIVL